MKFTVIYNVYVGNGHYVTKIARVIQEKDETILNMLSRESISDPEFIFHGWPKMEGETQEVSSS